MILKALTDIMLNKKKIAAGEQFEATDSQAELLFSFGWVEKVVKKATKEEEAPKPKKTTKKK